MPARPRPPSPRRRTVVLGVTGLPASGKSAVTAMLVGLGAEGADADALAHRALRLPRVRDRVLARIGPSVRAPGGDLDRAALGALAFRRPAVLRLLERLVHPVVRADLRAAVAGARRRRAPAVALDVPLLFEAGVDALCDATLFVEAPRAVRRARAARRGWSAAELLRRDRRQAPAAERRRRADFVVRNGGSLRETRAAVREIWRATVGEADAGRRQGRRDATGRAGRGGDAGRRRRGAVPAGPGTGGADAQGR